MAQLLYLSLLPAFSRYMSGTNYSKSLDLGQAIIIISQIERHSTDRSNISSYEQVKVLPNSFRITPVYMTNCSFEFLTSVSCRKDLSCSHENSSSTTLISCWLQQSLLWIKGLPRPRRNPSYARQRPFHTKLVLKSSNPPSQVYAPAQNPGNRGWERDFAVKRPCHPSRFVLIIQVLWPQCS